MDCSSHVYNENFYDYISEGSRNSAEAVVPLVLEETRMNSILDVGAGNGSWLAIWMANGISDALAIDGAYVDATRLAVPSDRFMAHDLSRPLDLGRRYDLVQSLEVAEHIAEDRADCFVDSLCRHGDVILFSAAVRNQGGEFHINEQPPEYWRRKFAARGYHCFDWLRPIIADRHEIKPWYRFNMVMYANAAGQRRLGKSALGARLPESRTLAGRGDLAWRARRMAVALMPRQGVHMLAMAKSAIEARANGRNS
jgi:hypothetical protein